MDRISIRLTTCKPFANPMAFGETNRIYNSWVFEWKDGGVYQEIDIRFLFDHK